MVCGIYGVYYEVPEDTSNPGNPVLPGDALFPTQQEFPIYVQIDDTDIYPVKGSLQWSPSAGADGSSTCACSVILPTAERPQPFMRIRIGAGSMTNTIFYGVILSVFEKLSSGTSYDANQEYEYQIRAVSFAHYAVRKIISISKRDIYAGEVVKKILSEFFSGQLSAGKIKQGAYYPMFQTKNEQAATVLQRLAQDSNYMLYVDEDRKLHFYEIGDQNAPFDLSNTWQYNGAWDFPINNYDDMSISEEGGQVLTRLVLHASSYVRHITTYKHVAIASGDITSATNATPIVIQSQLHGRTTGDQIDIVNVQGNTNANGSWTITVIDTSSFSLDTSSGNGTYASGGTWTLTEAYVDSSNPLGGTDTLESAEKNRFYHISPGQRTFFVGAPIGYIESIYASWVYYDTGGPIYHHIRWQDPIQSRKSGGMTSRHPYVDFGEQFMYLYGLSPFPGALYSYWTPGQGFVNPIHALNWELPPNESGRDHLETYLEGELESPTGVTETEIEEFPFDWKIGYGSNTVEFNDNVELPEEEEIGKMKFLRVDITYAEKVYTRHTYNNHDRQATIRSYDNKSDGVFETHIEERELTDWGQKAAYAQALFDNRSDPRISVSYTHYVEGPEILNQNLIPGMEQDVDVHGRNLTLTVESVSCSLVNGVVPIFKMDVQLATRQRDLAGLVKRLIQGR